MKNESTTAYANPATHGTRPIYATRIGIAYTGQSARAHLTRLDADGTLRVWDSVGQIYTTCHILPADAPIERAAIQGMAQPEK